MTEQELEYIRTWFTVWLLKYGDVPLSSDVFFDLKQEANSIIGNQVSATKAEQHGYIKQSTSRIPYIIYYQINKRP